MKEYWFKFLASPSERELRILDAIIETCDGLEANQKAVLLSLFDPRLATAERPFYLSGNCHVFTGFCQDQRLLDLQGVAKADNKGEESPGEKVTVEGKEKLKQKPDVHELSQCFATAITFGKIQKEHHDYMKQDFCLSCAM